MMIPPSFINMYFSLVSEHVDWYAKLARRTQAVPDHANETFCLCALLRPKQLPLSLAKAKAIAAAPC